MQNSLTKGVLAVPDASDERVGLQRALDHRFQSQTKPPGSLGVLESIARRIALIQKTLTPRIETTRICVFAGSHGIAHHGVSAFPPQVTAQMVGNFLSGGAAVCVLARSSGASVHVIDCGVEGTPDPSWSLHENYFYRSARQGTRSFTTEPAMTAQECDFAMGAGREQIALALKDRVEAVGLGEMGIGNSTSASALFCAILGLNPEEVTGRGTGVDEQGLHRKIAAIKTALNTHSVNGAVYPSRYWLERVGGFEIAAMAGAILEASEKNLPIVVDGFISTAAALVALQLNPKALDVCFFAHQSAEHGHSLILAKIGATPLLSFGMRLGEGSGSALAMPVLRGATRLLCEMATFESAGVSRSEEAPKPR